MSSLEQIKANKNYRIAAITLLLLLLWMASGALFSNNQDDEATTTAESKPLYSVRAKYIEAQPYTPQLRVSARTEANRTVNIRAEVSGQVSRLPVEKGQLVKTGDVICELAVEDRQLRVEQTKAEVTKTKLDHDAALRLKTSGFQARTVIAEKKLALETARANLRRRELDLEKIKILAPFDGVVEDRPVEIGDLMQRGDVCATVSDFNPLLVVGQVSGMHINNIKTGDHVSTQLLTGEQADGTIRFIGNSSDNLTRTFRLEVAVENTNNLLRSGITADILLSTSNAMAHLISPSLLSLDDSGNLGLRILNSQSQVEYANVSMLGDDTKGVWVSGLPQHTLLITVGSEYVSSGETVSVMLENNTQTVNKNVTKPASAQLKPTSNLSD